MSYLAESAIDILQPDVEHKGGGRSGNKLVNTFLSFALIIPLTL